MFYFVFTIHTYIVYTCEFFSTFTYFPKNTRRGAATNKWHHACFTVHLRERAPVSVYSIVFVFAYGNVWYFGISIQVNVYFVYNLLNRTCRMDDANGVNRAHVCLEFM